MSTHSHTLPRTDDRRLAGLALLLAVLAVPGCTIAWELPAGGFWIGVPLASAAIVLALRSGTPRAPAALAAIGLGAVLLLFTATWTVVSLVGG
jgi:hypothetical protein